MKVSTLPAVILGLLLLTGCGNDPVPPRVALALPDRAQFGRCMAVAPVVPTLPPYEAVNLPDGREAVLLSRVRDRDAITARFVVQEREGRLLCQAAVRYVDRWVEGVAAND